MWPIKVYLTLPEATIVVVVIAIVVVLITVDVIVALLVVVDPVIFSCGK